MAGQLPPGFDPRKLAGMMPAIEMPRRPTLREQLESTIAKGEAAKKLLEMLDNNPVIQDFVSKANEL